jgi:hypothetical protein
MSVSQASRWCASCGGSVLATRQGPNHLLHLVLTLFTCFMWAPFWAMVALTPRAWRCSRCGRKVYRSRWTTPVWELGRRR